MTDNCRIEIIGVDLFDRCADEIAMIDACQKVYQQGIGWHYHLDIAWLLNEMKDLPEGSTILDAGAGNGLIQYALLELGYNVVTTDFLNFTMFPGQAARYSQFMHYMNDQNAAFDNAYSRHMNMTQAPNGKSPAEIIEENKYRPTPIPLPYGARKQRFLNNTPEEHCGRLFIYKADILRMDLLEDNSIDAAVSVSALEHNKPLQTYLAAAEIERVVKPGGPIAITTSAALGEDWYHKASNGWCYSEKSLSAMFDLEENCPSNYDKAEELMETLSVENNPLHQRLAPFYKASGNNGMPWGIWKPQYQPVGIFKKSGTGKKDPAAEAEGLVHLRHIGDNAERR